MDETVEAVARAIERANKDDRYGLYDYSKYKGSSPPHQVKDHVEGKTLLATNDEKEARAFYEKLEREHPAHAAIEALKAMGWKPPEKE